MDSVGRILDFWFGELDEYGFAGPEKRKSWFAGKATDRLIEQNFGSLVVRALAGELDAWAEETPSLMALVTLLDQFPRNIYRGSARAFSGDQRSCELVNEAIARETDREMPPGWRSMFYLPLEHAENLADQNLCVAMLEAMMTGCPATHRDELVGSLEWARQHRDIIARFGRFPHRNKVLGRQPSPSEEAWLRGGGNSFGQ